MINFDKLKKFANCLENDFFFIGKEHYRLLAELSTNYNNSILYDIGTFTGKSALALSYNESNKIISYDIRNFVTVKNPGNIEFRIGNFFEDKEIFNSPFIMFDVDPHDGKIEEQFYQWLKINNYIGTVVFDDIHLNKEMNSFWDSITEEKIDLTEKGHWSGTGIVYFK